MDEQRVARELVAVARELAGARRRTSRQWVTKFRGIKDLIDAGADGDMTPTESGRAIAKLLKRESRRLKQERFERAGYITDDYEWEDLQEELEQIVTDFEQGSDTADDVDNILYDLYNWADKYGVWID